MSFRYVLQILEVIAIAVGHLTDSAVVELLVEAHLAERRILKEGEINLVEGAKTHVVGIEQHYGPPWRWESRSANGSDGAADLAGNNAHDRPTPLRALAAKWSSAQPARLGRSYTSELPDILHRSIEIAEIWTDSGVV